jgi:hypothetical protein
MKAGPGGTSDWKGCGAMLFSILGLLYVLLLIIVLKATADARKQERELGGIIIPFRSVPIESVSTAEVPSDIVLGGHLKSGQLGSLQNRPVVNHHPGQ